MIDTEPGVLLRSEHKSMDRISEHFTIEEHFCQCRKCEEQRIDPRLYPALERLRSKVGRSLPITSGFRCEAHNRAIGGKRFSQHVHGTAVDIAVPNKHQALRIARAAVEFGFGGVGLYETFVHLDLRETKSGKLSVWGSQAAFTQAAVGRLHREMERQGRWSA